MGNHRSPYATKVGESQFGDSEGSEKEELIFRSIIYIYGCFQKNRDGPPTWMGENNWKTPHGWMDDLGGSNKFGNTKIYFSDGVALLPQLGFLRIFVWDFFQQRPTARNVAWGNHKTGCTTGAFGTTLKRKEGKFPRFFLRFATFWDPIFVHTIFCIGVVPL